ncbi:hypothetical protein P171DRAFT_484502 [Karstenula rhodostoma CBS 690.94]|uniref:Uncharacterized protein n=1 Tax=Karstenula rhodostoma CBS 690.94 TaxID=1392251 RepID=A0A9P4PM61_9PLEO|nr:hypothetical protein P171DRAFT_484502 [Karstenula rhodostoma CBS 690.94]
MASSTVQPNHVGIHPTPSMDTLRSDPYNIEVYGTSAMENLAGNERFAQRKDTVTNDFFAVLTFPVVAVGHFFHQVIQQTGRKGHDKTLHLQDALSSLNRDHVQFVAAIEAPLTVCEDFMLWSLLLYLLAARKGHVKRISLIVVVGTLCLAPELLLLVNWVPFDSSLLLRPFLFHVQPFIVPITCWNILTAATYPMEIVLVLFRAPKTAD